MKRSTRLKVLPGLMCLCLMGSGCRSVHPVILQCPAIPQSLTEPCHTPEGEIVTNGDLARAYVESEGCRREDAVKFKAIRELAQCRVE